MHDFILTHDAQLDGDALAVALDVGCGACVISGLLLFHPLQRQISVAHYDAALLVVHHHLTLFGKGEKL